jgi:hypothetical protein
VTAPGDTEPPVEHCPLCTPFVTEWIWGILEINGSSAHCSNCSSDLTLTPDGAWIKRVTKQAMDHELPKVTRITPRIIRKPDEGSCGACDEIFPLGDLINGRLYMGEKRMTLPLGTKWWKASDGTVRAEINHRTLVLPVSRTMDLCTRCASLLPFTPTQHHKLGNVRVDQTPRPGSYAPEARLTIIGPYRAHQNRGIVDLPSVPRLKLWDDQPR